MPSVRSVTLVLGRLPAITLTFFCAALCLSCERPVDAQDPHPNEVSPPAFIEAPTWVIAQAPVALSPGQPADMVLRVTPRAGFKINLEYPWRLEIAPTDALAIDQLEWEREDAAVFSEDQAVFRVRVSGDEVGDYGVGGQLQFSVCSESLCELPRAEVSWHVAVR